MPNIDHDVLTGVRTKAALRAKRTSGQKMGGHVPYGFRLDADGPTLIEDATEHAVIQRITVMRSSGSTYHRIADMLNGEHVPTRTGKPWSGKVLWRILKRQAS